MMWFRRVIAIALIFISLLLFTAALLLTEINSTVANPGFYKEQLARADIYNFVYDEALPVALDEIDEDSSSDIPIELADFKSEITSAAREIAPPEWLQEQVESAIDVLVPYFTGDKDQFTVRIEVGELVAPTADAIIEIFPVQQTYDYLLDQIITPMVAEQLEDGVDLPFKVSLSEEEISSAIKQILPPGWIHDRFVEIVRASEAYIQGTETISVNIDLTERKADASDVITAIADQELEVIFNGLPEVSMAEFLLEIV